MQENGKCGLTFEVFRHMQPGNFCPASLRGLGTSCTRGLRGIVIDSREGMSQSASNRNIWVGELMHKIDDLLCGKENSSQTKERRVWCSMQRLPINLPTTLQLLVVVDYASQITS